ncbi:hypothetical protein JKP88DRAFT_232320 [Tribonema minus]|uniref:Uncharacterized protein n=1 Tax=Tribonema minus TaxID=303371 RepID=A0A835ZDU7_9STRA|nr:hypothetical protein JKP88DRAFT_232320 [Tribonema minus]
MSAQDQLRSQDPLIEEVSDSEDKSKASGPRHRGAAVLADDNVQPVSGGPRLGKLKGLGESKKRKGGSKGVPAEAPAKGGLNWMPIILMFVVFGPAVLPVFVYLFDKVSTSDWGINMGLSRSLEAKLTDFYKQHNPTKLREVPSLARKYKGRDAEIMARLQDKYKRLEDLKKEEAEYAD